MAGRAPPSGAGPGSGASAPAGPSAPTADAGGGQLHRQGQPLQAAAQLGDGLRIGRRQLEGRVRGLGPRHEQLDGGGRRQVGDGPGRGLGAGHRQGWTSTTCSRRRCSGSRLVARTVSLETPASRASRSAAAASRCSRLSTTSKTDRSRGTSSALQGDPAPAARAPHHPGDRRHDGSGIGERRQIDEPDAIGEALRHLLRGGNRQSRLADATGPISVSRRTSSWARRLRTRASSSSWLISRVGCGGRCTGMRVVAAVAMVSRRGPQGAW